MADDASRKIDAIIASALPWQTVILSDLRKWAHEMGVDVVERIRWGAPYFDHAGLLFGFMAFKKHINLFFNKGALITDVHGSFELVEKEKGSRSVKIKETSTVDEQTIKQLFAEAIRVNQAGLKATHARPKQKALRTPGFLLTRLKESKGAYGYWKTLSTSHKWEYIEWITTAKRATTKERRMIKCVAMLEQQEKLNDKYR